MTNTELITLLATEKAGFKLVQIEAENALKNLDAKSCLKLADELYQSDVNQARMFAILIFGRLAATENAAYKTLRTKVIHDPDWRSQEMLARAFDQYCKDKGYEESLPVIKEWLAANEQNQRRAASEGLRIWTSRPYFKEHPDAAITLLSSLRADPSEYVRKSAGNALRDISKQHSELVESELKTWDLANRTTAFTYRLASKFIRPGA
jgi:3-methyladenine DNA glycosylase AlkC